METSTSKRSHVHHVTICKNCGSIIETCRCMGEKEKRYSVCISCATKAANEQNDVQEFVDYINEQYTLIGNTYVKRDERSFVDWFNLIAQNVHETAVEKGWWSDAAGNRADRNEGEIFANFHAEISEAWEAWRVGNHASQKIRRFSEIEEELADVIIRIMDYGQARGFDIAGAIIAKHEYNQKRPFRHGGKKA